MKKSFLILFINFSLCANLFALNQHGCRYSVGEDEPSFYCVYSRNYSVAGLLGGITTIGSTCFVHDIVFLTEDGQTHWFPLTDLSYGTYVNSDHIPQFYSSGYFYPTENQIREIKQWKITKVFIITYDTEIGDNNVSTAQIELSQKHDCIYCRLPSDKPLCPIIHVDENQWDYISQERVNKWNPDNAHVEQTDISESPANAANEKEQCTNCTLLYNVDGTIQLCASLNISPTKSENAKKKAINNVTLYFTDETSMKVETPAHIFLFDFGVKRMISYSMAIPYESLHGKQLKLIDVTNNYGKVETDQTALVEMFNKQLGMIPKPTIEQSPNYCIIDPVEGLKTIPQLYIDTVKLYKKGLHHERLVPHVGDYTNSRHVYMEKDKATKKYNMCDKDGNEIIPPIFPKPNLTKRPNYFGLCLQLEELEQAGITMQMLAPLFDVASVVEYHLSSTKEWGFINRDGHKTPLQPQDYIAEANQNFVIVGSRRESNGVKRLFSVYGQDLGKSIINMCLYENGCVFVDSVLLNGEMKSVLPFAIQGHKPPYLATINGMVYFSNGIAKYPDNTSRDVIIAIPESAFIKE